MAFRRRTDFEDLPQPLFAKILDELEYSDEELMALRLVSKTWKSEIPLLPFSSILAVDSRPRDDLQPEKLGRIVPDASHLAFRCDI